MVPAPAGFTYLLPILDKRLHLRSFSGQKCAALVVA